MAITPSVWVFWGATNLGGNVAKAFEEMEQDSERLERMSGIPAPRTLGASRNEVIGLVLALLVFAAIAIGFWYEATH